MASDWTILPIRDQFAWLGLDCFDWIGKKWTNLHMGFAIFNTFTFTVTSIQQINDTFILSPGSAGSLAKSMRSEMGESGSESGGVDGDNINVVIR